MKKSFKNKTLDKSTWAKDILIMLASSAQATSIIFSRQSLYQKLNALERIDKNKVAQTLRILGRRKYIRIASIDGLDSLIKITPLGIKRLIKYDWDDLKLKDFKRWDGKWRVVIFDIPEKKKKVREAINLKLKDLGFEILQKSTFIYPYDCRDEIEFIRNYFYLKNEINLIVAEEIDNEEFYLKHFHLI